MPLKKGEIPLRRRRLGSGQAVTRKGRWVRRLALYEKVHRLRRAGCGLRAIARQLKMSRTTVNKYLAMRHFPERASRRRVPGILDPYIGYLSQRWKAGCRNAAQLWREIRERGYLGSQRQVTRWVYERREQPARTTPRQHLEPAGLAHGQRFKFQEAVDHLPLPSSRRLIWLLLRPIYHLDSEEQRLREQLLIHPVLAQAQQLVHVFQRGLRQRSHRTFDTWLKRCETSKIPELRRFAVGLRQDYLAVKAALHSPWSNGQTQGARS